jgi:hypothetical protein
MDAVVLPADAVHSGSFAENLFDPTPTDSRYLITSFAKFYPTNSLNANADAIQFELPELTANNLYMFHNTMFYMEAKITKADGTIPTGKVVGPINNVSCKEKNYVKVFNNTYFHRLCTALLMA